MVDADAFVDAGVFGADVLVTDGLPEFELVAAGWPADCGVALNGAAFGEVGTVAAGVLAAAACATAWLGAAGVEAPSAADASEACGAAAVLFVDGEADGPVEVEAAWAASAAAEDAAAFAVMFGCDEGAAVGTAAASGVGAWALFAGEAEASSGETGGSAASRSAGPCAGWAVGAADPAGALDESPTAEIGSAFAGAEEVLGSVTVVAGTGFAAAAKAARMAAAWLASPCAAWSSDLLLSLAFLSWSLEAVPAACVALELSEFEVSDEALPEPVALLWLVEPEEFDGAAAAFVVSVLDELAAWLRSDADEFVDPVDDVDDVEDEFIPCDVADDAAALPDEDGLLFVCSRSENGCDGVAPFDALPDGTLFGPEKRSTLARFMNRAACA